MSFRNRVLSLVKAAISFLRPPSDCERDDPLSAVERDALLDAAAKAYGGDLDWRASIVDLLKILHIDSDYRNRVQLAAELEIRDYQDSAEMNMRLHEELMWHITNRKLRVP